MAIYPNESWPSDTEIESLDGTTDAPTGLPYIAKGTGPASLPTYEVQYNRRQKRLAGILASWRQGMVVDEGNLTVGVYPMRYTLGGTHRTFAGVTGIGLADDSSKVVYLDASASVQITDYWPDDITSFLPLAEVDTAGGKTTISDVRVLSAFHVPSLESSGVRDRRIVTAHRANVGSGESDAAIFAFCPIKSGIVMAASVLSAGAS